MRRLFRGFGAGLVLFLLSAGPLCAVATPFLIVLGIPLCLLLAGPWHYHGGH